MLRRRCCCCCCSAKGLGTQNSKALCASGVNVANIESCERWLCVTLEGWDSKKLQPCQVFRTFGVRSVVCSRCSGVRALGLHGEGFGRSSALGLWLYKVVSRSLHKGFGECTLAPETQNWEVSGACRSMFACMHVCDVYLYTYIHTYIRTFVPTYMHTCPHAHMHTYMCLFICIDLHLSTYLFVCLFVHLFPCLFIVNFFSKYTHSI